MKPKCGEKVYWIENSKIGNFKVKLNFHPSILRDYQKEATLWMSHKRTTNQTNLKLIHLVRTCPIWKTIKDITVITSTIKALTFIIEKTNILKSKFHKWCHSRASLGLYRCRQSIDRRTFSIIWNPTIKWYQVSKLPLVSIWNWRERGECLQS